MQHFRPSETKKKERPKHSKTTQLLTGNNNVSVESMWNRLYQRERADVFLKQTRCVCVCVKRRRRRRRSA